MRLLEYKLDHQYSVRKILDSLKEYNCTHLDTNTWQFTFYDEVMEACGEAFGIKFNEKYRTQQEIQRILRY